MIWDSITFFLSDNENWLSESSKLILPTSIIAVLISTSFDLYLRKADEKKRKEATLYYPLYIACRGIIEVFQKYDQFKFEGTYRRFEFSSKTFLEISHESVRYLKRDSLKIFLDLRCEVDELLTQLKTESWASIEYQFKNDEYNIIKKNAYSLLSQCKKNVKNIKDSSE